MDQETIKTIGLEEQERLAEAKKNFCLLRPEPVLEDIQFEELTYVEPTFKSEFGLQSVSMWLSVIGSVIVSALTVGIMLFISAIRTDANLLNTDSSDWIISLAKAMPVAFLFAGMIAFEGYALSHGLAVGREKGKESFSPWALIASFAVMCFAGLMRSFGLADMANANELVMFIYNLVTVLVIISMGVGAPLIVYFGAINIGAFTSKFEEKKKHSKEEFHKELIAAKEKYQQEKDELYASYQKRMDKFYQDFEKYYRSSADQLFGVDRTRQRATKTSSQSSHHEEVAENVRAKVRDFLKQLSILPSQVGKEGVISVARINDELGITDAVTKNNVSVYINGFKNQELTGKW